MKDEGITIVLDLTGASEWDRILRPFAGVAIRRTTSSRTPGKVNEGVVHRRGKSQLVKCICGSMRHDFGGPHSPRALSNNEVIDCQGVIWRKENGTWRRPPTEAATSAPAAGSSS